MLVRRYGAQPPLSPVYNGPDRVLERSTHFFLLEMGRGTNKVSTICLKAAQTQADTEPAKPPRMGRPVAQAPPVRAPPTQRWRPRQVTFNNIINVSIQPPASQRPAAEPTKPLSLPPQSLGRDLWWRTVRSCYVSRLDRHVTYYTSHMLYICTYSP
jgi:hypothetical protein